MRPKIYGQAERAGDRATDRMPAICRPSTSSFSRIWEIRPSPDGRAVAFVSEAAAFLSWNAGDLNILAVAVDGSSRAVVVAPPTAVSPDWTPQGRSLVYLDAAATETNGRRLGSLLERDVLDASGHIQLGEPKVLAGLVFEDSNRVRCLADGRVLFDAEDPSTHHHSRRTRAVVHGGSDAGDAHDADTDLPRDQLEELPESLALFEVSPDSRQVLFAGDGEVLLLTLATGTIERFRREIPALTIHSCHCLFGGRPANLLRETRGGPERACRTAREL